jgi:hypothetical protein
MRETLIKGSDNVITIRLEENGVPIAGAWTALDLYIGVDGFNIHRTSNTAGINLTAGTLTITPGLLSESLASLPAGDHIVKIRVQSSGNPNGAYFGAGDSEKIVFTVEDPPP